MTKDEIRTILREQLGFQVPPSELIPTPVIVRFLDYSDTTLQKWRDAGVGPPAIKSGGRWNYKLASLSEWMQKGDARRMGAVK
jgi:Helix-turn-helix domain